MRSRRWPPSIQGGFHVCVVVFRQAADVAVGDVDHHGSAGRPRSLVLVSVIAMSRVIQLEVCTAIRALWASVPPFMAPIQQHADYQIRKAELLDLVAATDPCLYAQASELAVRARQEAHAIAALHHQQQRHAVDDDG